MVIRKSGSDRSDAESGPVPVITVSGQTGSRSSELCELIAEKLDYTALSIEHIDAFDESSEHYAKMMSLLDDQFKASLPELVDAIEVDLSDEPARVKHHCNIVLCLAELGGVVLQNWAANYILGPECGLHIRILCPNANRVQNMARESGLPVGDARKLLKGAYTDGYAFLMKQLRYDVWDESQYDLTLNTGYMGPHDLADVAVAAARAKAAGIRERRLHLQ